MDETTSIWYNDLDNAIICFLRYQAGLLNFHGAPLLIVGIVSVQPHRSKVMMSSYVISRSTDVAVVTCYDCVTFHPIDIRLCAHASITSWRTCYFCFRGTLRSVHLSPTLVPDVISILTIVACLALEVLCLTHLAYSINLRHLSNK
jgi:hypothetical protein